MVEKAKPFFWYELMTTDPKAATEFYTAVVGWSAAPFGGDGGMPYTAAISRKRSACSGS